MMLLNNFLELKEVQREINNSSPNGLIQLMVREKLYEEDAFKLIHILFKNNIMSDTWELMNFYLSTLFYHLEEYFGYEMGVEFNSQNELFKLSDPMNGVYILDHDKVAFKDSLTGDITIICKLDDYNGMIGIDMVIKHMVGNPNIPRYIRGEIRRVRDVK